MSDTTNDIDALLTLLAKFGWAGHHATARALVAERDELKQRHAHLSQSYTMLAKECDALKQRVAELEALPPADRDLRERLVESALQGAARDAHMHHEASSMGTRAVYMVDAAIAAMRKGDANA